MNSSSQGVHMGGGATEGITFTSFGREKQLTADDLYNCFGKKGLTRKWNQIKLVFTKGIWVNDRTVKKLLGKMTFGQLQKIDKQYTEAVAANRNKPVGTKEYTYTFNQKKDATAVKTDSFQKILHEEFQKGSRRNDPLGAINHYIEEKGEDNIKNSQLLKDFGEVFTDADFDHPKAGSREDEIEFVFDTMKEHLEGWIKDGTINADDIESGLKETVAAQKILEGEALRTTIPVELSGGISFPKNEDEIPVMQLALVSNVDKLREALIAQVPNAPLNLGARVGSPGQFFGNNNYVLSLAQHDNISYDSESNTITVLGEGETDSFQPYKAYTVKDGVIVVGEGIMCDDGLQSKKTFDERFAIHSFNDGNGWGLKSRNAAVEANRVAVETLESELGKLAHKETVTHQDIIRAQDKALFAAQEYVTAHADDDDSSKKTGTTCPQVMTVAGNTAHISSIGDSKAFIISSNLGTVREPTKGNRGGFNAKDPGGRIGGWVKGPTGELTEPDLRNYAHNVAHLKSGDIVIMCSDGIHDNLDPKTLGLSPKDVDPSLTGEEWDDNDPSHVEARNKFVGTKLQQVLQEYKKEKKLTKLSQKDVNNALNGFVQNISLKRKLDMIKTGGKEPESKKDFPGKLDHAGIIVYQHP